MDQKIKKLWIKALLSGEFKQCKGHLSKNGQYCALGVLSVLEFLKRVEYPNLIKFKNYLIDFYYSKNPSDEY